MTRYYSPSLRMNYWIGDDGQPYGWMGRRTRMKEGWPMRPDVFEELLDAKDLEVVDDN